MNLLFQWASSTHLSDSSSHSFVSENACSAAFSQILWDFLPEIKVPLTFAFLPFHDSMPFLSGPSKTYQDLSIELPRDCPLIYSTLPIRSSPGAWTETVAYLVCPHLQEPLSGPYWTNFVPLVTSTPWWCCKSQSWLLLCVSKTTRAHLWNQAQCVEPWSLSTLQNLQDFSLVLERLETVDHIAWWICVLHLLNFSRHLS